MNGPIASIRSMSLHPAVAIVAAAPRAGGARRVIDSPRHGPRRAVEASWQRAGATATGGSTAHLEALSAGTDTR